MTPTYLPPNGGVSDETIFGNQPTELRDQVFEKLFDLALKFLPLLRK